MTRPSFRTYSFAQRGRNSELESVRVKGKIIEAGRVDLINKVTMAAAAQYLYSSQGLRRIARLFDERGCKIRAGKNAFVECLFGTNEIAMLADAASVSLKIGGFKMGHPDGGHGTRFPTRHTFRQAYAIVGKGMQF